MFDIFVTAAQAAEAPAQANPIMTFLPLILLFVVFYFILIRPQQKRTKEQKNMVANLKVGDEVVSNGGVLGRIIEANENFLKLQIAQSTVITLQRHAVAALMPKGTYAETSSSDVGYSRSSGSGNRRRNQSRRQHSDRTDKYQEKDQVNSEPATEARQNKSSRADFNKGISRSTKTTKDEQTDQSTRQKESKGTSDAS